MVTKFLPVEFEGTLYNSAAVTHHEMKISGWTIVVRTWNAPYLLALICDKFSDNAAIKTQTMQSSVHCYDNFQGLMTWGVE